MSPDFASRLADAVRRAGPVVVGLDPRIQALPDNIAPGAPPADRIQAYYREALPVLAPHVAAVKPNIAFFERYGAAGLAAYEATCRQARECGVLVIGDIKRGDIGSTAEAYAAYHLDLADAVTLQPYLGSDSLQPFFARCVDDGKGVFVLVRTSNPSAAELQDLDVGEERLCDRVARAVHQWGAQLAGDGDDYTPVGAVVGATSPDDLRRLRGLMPRAWLLLPGVGAQGATEADTAAAFDDTGLGGLISQSRGVMHAAPPSAADWRAQLSAAADAFAKRAREAASQRSTP